MPAASKNRPSPEELRALYVDQRLSSLAIAERCQVEKITVLRWLRAAGIERRPVGSGLANRGVEMPTAEELHRLIHVENIGLRGVAERYGVYYTAVGKWLDRYGIERPTVWQTRRRGEIPAEPTEEELRERIAAGESLSAIARDYPVSSTLIRQRCRTYGIEFQRDGWQLGKRFPCADGHLARSTYELRVDDWLFDHGLQHDVEPAYPWDRRYRADFLVGQTYIEVWGVTNNAAYRERRALKIQRCAETGLDLIQINYGQFSRGRRWWRPLEQLLT